MRTALAAILLLAASAISAQNPQPAQSADQLRDLAKQARKSGDLEGEAKDLCQAARLDAKKYDKKCEKAEEDLRKVLLQFLADLDMGKAEIQRKDYAGAVRDLSKITFGPDREQAQVLIRQARIEGNLGSPDQVSQLALATADAAYSRGDFDSAEEMLKRVQTPSMKAAANQLETNINSYRTDMKEAEALAQSGDLKGAAEKYQAAAVIRPNGPGQPLEHAQTALLAQAKADQEKARKEAEQQQAAAQGPTAEELAQAKANTAEKIKGLLRVAHREETAGDLKGALQAYQSVLLLDDHQPQATAGKKRMLEQLKSAAQSTEDGLIEGITAFYASQFDAAKEVIGKYLQSGGGKHEGAAHFYLGAALLCQVFLSGPKDAAQSSDLNHQAEDQFALAKQLHYAPLPAAISPRILAAWTQAASAK